MTTVSLKALPATSENLGLHGGTTHAFSIQVAPGLQQDMEGMGDKEGVSWGALDSGWANHGPGVKSQE